MCRERIGLFFSSSMRVRLSNNKRVVSPCGGLSAVAPLLHNIRQRRCTHASRGEDNELPFKPQNDQGFASFGAYTHTHTTLTLQQKSREAYTRDVYRNRTRPNWSVKSLPVDIHVISRSGPLIVRN